MGHYQHTAHEGRFCKLEGDGVLPAARAHHHHHVRAFDGGTPMSDHSLCHRRERFLYEAAPPEHEDMEGIDESLIEDLEAGEEDAEEAEDIDADERRGDEL